MKARENFKYDPLTKLSILQKRIYKRIPVTFTTGEGVEIAVAMGMGERTFKSWLTTDFFILTQRGHYERRYK